MKTSPAYRVHRLLQKAVAHPQTQPASSPLHVCARAFGIEDAPEPDKAIPAAVEDQVLELLRDLRMEVREIELAFAGTEAAEALESLADTLRNLTSNRNLIGDWSQIKERHLRADILAGWKWAAIHLPTTDDEITDEALARLRTELEELDETARAENIPDELRRFVQRRVRTIREALRRYQIRGIAPLEDALSQGAGELLREQEELSSAGSKDPAASAKVIAKLQVVWKTATEFCGGVDKIHKGYIVFMQLYDKLLPLLGHDASGSGAPRGGGISI